jgi:fused signal recognition particle receptor
MFDLLKKKIAGFTEKILGHSTEQTKPTPPAPAPEVAAPPLIEETKIETLPPIAEAPIIAPTPTLVVEKKELPAKPKFISPVPVEETSSIEPLTPTALPEIQQRDEREIKAKIGVTQKVTSLLTGTVTLKPETVQSFLEEFELSLLEADVELETAQSLITQLEKRLSGKTISSREDPNTIILSEIKAALYEILPPTNLDFDQRIETQKPFVILILGPNGAGKTTTIAKLTHYLKKKGKSVVLASADTFRAGSIEQLAIHAEKLGVRLIKHQYGADPAAVAFDTVKAAQAENADVVIIDTAGRQDTNKNLLEELKKIQRVIQPHFKIYIGESYTGQAILTQVETFDQTIGIDGFILTKLDTDTKGGGVLTILHRLKKPILFFGVGQGYDDLIPFSLDAFLERLIPTV